MEKEGREFIIIGFIHNTIADKERPQLEGRYKWRILCFNLEIGVRAYNGNVF